jgi:hypothetical protein
MTDRTREEIEVLRQKYPDLTHGDDWVLIPVFPLPAGRFNKQDSKVLFTIPVGYPNTGPDNFAVDGDLRLKDGASAPAFNPGSNVSGWVVPIPGDWGWFSWHPQQWRPAATADKGDNLLGFVRGVALCLRGEESA